MTKQKPKHLLGKGIHKEITASSFRKLLMRASPFFINDEEVMVSVAYKGYASFIVHMLSTYLAELFDSVKWHSHKLDYNMAWVETAGQYCQLLGIDKEYINVLLNDYIEYIRRVEEKDEDVLPDLPNRKAQGKNEAN